jgi:hypothetical protein
MGLTVDLAIGGSLSGVANVALSNIQRIGTDLARGEEVTASSITEDFSENVGDDMLYGAAGYGIGRGFAGFGKYFYQGGKSGPNIRSSLHDPFHPFEIKPQPIKLYNPSNAQKTVVGAVTTFVDVISNATLLDCVTRSCRVTGQ